MPKPKPQPKPELYSYHTDTAEGVIPHLEIACDAGIFHAPVKVTRDSEGGWHPMRDANGLLLYALPGGGECAARRPRPHRH